MGFQVFDGKKMIEENPEYIFFNGRPWSLVEKDGILKAKVGDRVYPEASTGQPLINVQTTLIPAGGATITEFMVDVPGDYVQNS